MACMHADDGAARKQERVRWGDVFGESLEVVEQESQRVGRATFAGLGTGRVDTLAVNVEGDIEAVELFETLDIDLRSDHRATLIAEVRDDGAGAQCVDPGHGELANSVPIWTALTDVDRADARRRFAKVRDGTAQAVETGEPHRAP